jgi:aliphatic sulfonates family ABC transporter substrate-binding protein
MMRKKKLGVIVLSFSVLAGAMMGCGSSGAADTDAKSVEIHFAVQPGISEFVLNESKQYIEQSFDGDNVEIVYDTFAGGPAIMEAMASGNVDFAITGDVPVLSAVGNGNAVEGIYRCAWDPEEEQVIALSDSGIKSVDDLAGKKVGLAFGSANHSFFLQLLSQNGYSVDDVELINISPADLEISLQQGDVDAGVIQESSASIIKNDLGAEEVASTDGVCESIKILSVRKAFAEEYQDYTDKIVKAISDLDEYTIENPDEVKELLAESNNNSVEDWVSVDRYVYKGEFDETALENATNSIQFLYDNKSISAVYDASEAFDNSYYERACK